MADGTPGARAAPRPSPVARDSGFSALHSLFDSRAALAGILVIAAALRFLMLGHNSLTFDEMYLLRIALTGWQGIPGMLKTAEFHPPLFHLLTKAWLSVAPDLSDGTLRVLPAFLSVASVVLTYAVARRLSSESVALLSALLVAVSPFSIMSGQELRMYPLVTVLFLASTCALIDGVDRGGGARWALYVTLATALLYTHYLGILLLAGQGIWVAWFARPRLREWGVAILIVSALFAPWAPALLVQGAHGAWWIGEGSPVQYLAQILGLFAFGGSLFGMPDYHYVDTTLRPAGQFAILLPFLVVLGVGLRALLSPPRRCAVIALPSALALGIPLLLALGKANIAARWYAFLVPVYALCLAQGTVEIAARVRGRQRAAVVCLTAALLVCPGAVLWRYYVDPDFALYHWRERAAQIRTLARPDDFFVYAIRLDAAAFTYYFGSAYPGMVLFPNPDFDRLRRVAAQHPRVWLVMAPPATDTMLTQAVEALRGPFPYVTRLPGDGAKPMFPIVYLFQPGTSVTR